MKFNIQGLRDQGMNDRQINRYIKKTERDLRRQLSKPRKLLPGASVDQVKVSNMGLGSAEDAPPTQSALQGRMGVPSAPTFVGAMKKGGGAKKYEKGGKINLGACSVSTASKSKKSPNW